MAWKLSGTYVAHCDCRQICPCAVDGPPTGRDGQCHGLLVYHVRDGNLDDTDLSGLNVVLGYFAPSNISAGDLRMGIVVDEGASDEQTAALEQIFSGMAGGLFGEFAALVEEWQGVERQPVSFSDGEEPSARIGEIDVNFEAFRDQEGTVTTSKNAAFGFAPEFILGKSSGRSGVFGESFEASYGEAAEFEYTS
jgi:hypothetical protein